MFAISSRVKIYTMMRKPPIMRKLSAVLVVNLHAEYILCPYVCQDNKIIDYFAEFDKIFPNLGALYESEVYSQSYGTNPERYSYSI